MLAYRLHTTGDITKQARTAILRLGKRPRSATEMAEAIEYLRTTRAQEQVQLSYVVYPSTSVHL